MKAQHDLLHTVLQVNQSKTSPLLNLPHCIESTRIDAVTSSCCSPRNALWLIAMHFGKNRWIQFVLPSIYSSYILIIHAARSLRSLRSNKLKRKSKWNIPGIRHSNVVSRSNDNLTESYISRFHMAKTRLSKRKTGISNLNLTDFSRFQILREKLWGRGGGEGA